MNSAILFEDDAKVRTSMVRYFNHSQRVKLIKAFSNAQSVVEDWTNHPADVVLMDINMPKVNGLEALQLLKKADPAVKVLMLTSHDSDDFIFQALQRGAWGYALKGNDPEDLEKAIEDLVNGGSYMSPSIARRVMLSFEKVVANPEPEQVHLTLRELDALTGLVQGLSRKLIADKLGITLHTVNEHLGNVYKKLQINSAPEAIREANRLKLLPQDSPQEVV